MQKQRGFTLIELIIVIIILGILAVTAAPRFFDFGSDARIATLKGVEGSINGAANVVYGRASIEGVQNLGADTNGEYRILEDGTEVIFGYPAATEDGIQAVISVSAGDWQFVHEGGDAGGTNGTKIVPQTIFDNLDDQDFGDINTCHVLYTEAEDADSEYTVTIEESGC